MNSGAWMMVINSSPISSFSAGAYIKGETPSKLIGDEDDF